MNVPPIGRTAVDPATGSALGVSGNTPATRSALQLSVAFDRDLARPIIKLVDTATGETVREIPNEELRAAAAEINRYLGVLVDRTT